MRRNIRATIAAGILTLMFGTSVSANSYYITQLNAIISAQDGSIGGSPVNTGDISVSLDSSGPNIINIASGWETQDAYVSVWFPLLNTLGEPNPVLHYSESALFGGFGSATIAPVTISIVSAGPQTAELLGTLSIMASIVNINQQNETSGTLYSTFTLESLGSVVGTGTLTAATPLPSALLLMLTGLASLGSVAFRRHRKNAALMAA